MGIMDNSDWHDNDKGILEFQEEYPDIYAGFLNLLEGESGSAEAQMLRDEYPDIHDAMLKLIENGEYNENLQNFKEEYPEIYNHILNTWKKWQDHSDNWHDDNEILEFQEEYPVIYAAVMEMVAGDYESEAVQ